MNKPFEQGLGAAVPEALETPVVQNAFTMRAGSLSAAFKRMEREATIARRATSANDKARIEGRRVLGLGGPDERNPRYSPPVIGRVQGAADTDNNRRIRKASI